ncbi:hypothetical protein V6N13_026970 [Hibiscus sabdariffa]|uniref:Uncharacterized protein n=2 Tax=Hibiscus sabdariffa TaxID=183260 RepID=A0ABR2B3X5_9ROSI
MVSKDDGEKQRELDIEEEQSVGTDGGDQNALPTVFEGIEGREKGRRGKGKGKGGNVDGRYEGENGTRQGKEEFETEERQGFMSGFFQDVIRFDAR